MGNFLSIPIKEKETQDGGQEGGPRFGAAAMQGWRVRMEDAHVAEVALGDPEQRLSLFGVFDGHGGPEVAKFCAEHVTEVLLDNPAFKRGDWEGALAQSFLALDRQLAAEEGQRELGLLARAEREKAREQARGREPEVTLEEVAEQTGLSQACIRQYVLAAWRRRPASASAASASASASAALAPAAASASGSDEEEGSGSSSSGSDQGEPSGRREGDGARAVASSASVPMAAVGAKRRRDDRGEEEVEVHGDGEETTAAATTSDASSSSNSSNSGADSLASPPVASGRDGQQEAEEVEVEEGVLLVVRAAEGSSGEEGEGEGSSEDEEEEEEALRSIDFRRMKEQLVRARPGYDSGSTAVVALLQGREALVVANAGDSRCVLSRGGRALELSRDHKPDDPQELARIRAAGGSVADGRVEGNLNLSRALGDLTYKQEARLPPARQMITAQPEVRTLALTPQDDFLVMACDGIWNVLSSQQVVDHVRAGLAQSPSRGLSALCEELCDRCCDEEVTDESDGAGMDNMTVLIILLPPPGQEHQQQHHHHHHHHHHRRHHHHRHRSHRHHQHQHHGGSQGESGDEEQENEEGDSSDTSQGAGCCPPEKRAKTGV